MWRRGQVGASWKKVAAVTPPAIRLAPWMLMLCLGGCSVGEASREVGREATPQVLASGLQELAQPQNRELLATVLADLPVEELSRRVTAGSVAGVVESGLAMGAQGQAVEPDVAAERVDRLLRPYVTATAQLVGEAVEAEVTPRLQRVTQAAVASAMEAATQQHNQAALARAGAAVGAGAGDAFTANTAAGVEERIGPAIAGVVTDDLTPAVTQLVGDLPQALATIDPQGLAALGESAARTIAHGAVLGIDDATDELVQTEQASAGETTLIGRGQQAVQSGMGFVYVLLAVMGVMLLALAAWLVVMLLQVRQVRSETHDLAALLRDQRAGSNPETPG